MNRMRISTTRPALIWALAGLALVFALHGLVGLHAPQHEGATTDCAICQALLALVLVLALIHFFAHSSPARRGASCAVQPRWEARWLRRLRRGPPPAFSLH